MNLLTVLLQAADPAQGGAGDMLKGMWPILLIIVIFYFFMIRPQQKKAKEIRKQRDSMEKGTKVVTSGGMYGILREVKDTVAMLEIADGVIIKVDKNSIYLSSEDIQQQGK